MTFVHANEMELWAGFLQNGMQNLKAGHDAEITFDAVPGRAFSGHVEKVSPAIAQGQLVPSGELINFDLAAQRAQQGREVKLDHGFRTHGGNTAEVVGGYSGDPDAGGEFVAVRDRICRHPGQDALVHESAVVIKITPVCGGSRTPFISIDQF